MILFSASVFWSVIVDEIISPFHRVDFDIDDAIATTQGRAFLTSPGSLPFFAAQRGARRSVLHDRLWNLDRFVGGDEKSNESSREVGQFGLIYIRCRLS